MSTEDETQDLNAAIAQGGSYEVIRQRLISQGQALQAATETLNNNRLEEFGRFDMQVVSRVRMRTEHNCVARDLVQVGDYLLLGYTVFIGLRTDTHIGDVFSLYKKTHREGNVDFQPESLVNTFLNETRFVADFEELHRYYKQAKLLQLAVVQDKLLAAFQIGERLEDMRVFRWALNQAADGNSISYIDNRGERDLLPPPAFDFTWLATGREHHVQGRHPHINIANSIFVETINGDLTVKIENNTEDGLGIYREPVEDQTQSLDDASVFYAICGGLILLKIRPYREETWRYLVFNTLTQNVLRIDNMGLACQQLPEQQGIIFPGGYYLQSGEYKLFDTSPFANAAKIEFRAMVRSPNGEDVLYEFYEPISGLCCLLTYNLIEKNLLNPIYGHGYALADDGELVVFTAEVEPTRVHPMQIWQTAFFSSEYAAAQPPANTFYGKIGNNELVRGISALFGLVRAINSTSVNIQGYEALLTAAGKMFDTHYWLKDPQLNEIAQLLNQICVTTNLVIDEFEKVLAIRQASAESLKAAASRQRQTLANVQPDNWTQAFECVEAIGQLHRLRGQLATLKELRYVDLVQVQQLDEEIGAAQETVHQAGLVFLQQDKALAPYHSHLASVHEKINSAQNSQQIAQIVADLDKQAGDINLLTDVIGTLPISDPLVRTRILEQIAQIYGLLNQARANAKHQQKTFGGKEAVAQFAAQIQLYAQSVTQALNLAETPDEVDAQLTKCLLRLEDLEGRFSDYDEFLADIVQKRESVYETFQERKQHLIDARQQKTQNLVQAAERILASVEKRARTFKAPEELSTFFVSDSLVLKIAELCTSLQSLDAGVKAEDLRARLAAIKNQALRQLRDTTDLFEDNGKIIKLGRHKFSVNTQDLDLSLVSKEGQWYVHIAGTDFYSPLDDASLLAQQQLFAQQLESETQYLYRSEYLAGLILQEAYGGSNPAAYEALKHALIDDAQLLKHVREYAEPRYKEGYTRGIHDADAAVIVKTLANLQQQADLLIFNPMSRAVAQLFWALSKDGRQKELWREQARSGQFLKQHFHYPHAQTDLCTHLREQISACCRQLGLELDAWNSEEAARYLCAELSSERVEFIISRYGQILSDALRIHLDEASYKHLLQLLTQLGQDYASRWTLAHNWLSGLLDCKPFAEDLRPFIPEAIILLHPELLLPQRHTQADVFSNIENLMGEHESIKQRRLAIRLDDFWQRFRVHTQQNLPAFRALQEQKQQFLARQRKALKLHEFTAKPLSAFVRNKLINDAYLPIVGDNLAKQMGSLGEHKRTDLMGLLMLISPPGYGKTTLMEYIANRLGLIFVKINCPTLGHSVISLDPAQGPNATAAQELMKLNLALAMGNNVMLYLDDIQHTHAEFLQKFISLCDGTRRIEGIWQGQSHTYDLRGKKFAIVMAGNPYTESGETFKVPDMLANRADIYNLGDILGGMQESFALSYIENALTSNRVLAPLAQRDLNDVYKLVAMAKGQAVASSEFSHSYVAAEINEILNIMRTLFVLQDTVLKINQAYIASAAQDDHYRTEPPFKLQGSYRNMNKMTEKISAVTNAEELRQIIQDHYQGEAQMLTQGAEANLLKLGEIRQQLTPAQATRWEQIKQDFRRNTALGGDTDTGSRLVLQLASINQALSEQNSHNSQQQAKSLEQLQQLAKITAALLRQLMESPPKVEIINPPNEHLATVLTHLGTSLQSAIELARSQKNSAPLNDQLAELTLHLKRLRVQIDSLGQAGN